MFGEQGDTPPGTWVRLVDGRDRVAGWGLADQGSIGVRVLGRGAPPSDPVAEVAARIGRADAFRWQIAPPETDCWRVVNGAGDGLPGLVVDRYAALAVLRVYAAAWEPHLEAVVRALAGLGWPATVFRRYGVRRVDGREGGAALHGPDPAEALVVREHGMRLLVRPRVGQKTGLFLDQREHRALVRRWAAGRRTANLFAYNGGFSVAAALGGASRVTTVDVAPDAVADAREIFRLNDLDPAAHVFEVADVFAWEPPGAFGLLIVDPPSLARGRSSERAALGAYRSLHERLGPHVSRQGLLATASCTARLSTGQWKEAVREGLAGHGAWSWHWASGEPADHPVSLAHDEAHYLKFALLRRR